MHFDPTLRCENQAFSDYCQTVVACRITKVGATFGDLVCIVCIIERAANADPLVVRVEIYIIRTIFRAIISGNS